MHIRGTVVSVTQHGGCVEVAVVGEKPGKFPIDNCLVPAFLDPDGPGLVGRQVEYEAGMMRFLDEEEIQVQEPTPIIHFRHPTCSPDHV